MPAASSSGSATARSVSPRPQTPLTYDGLKGYWVCFGAATLSTELPSRAEGTLRVESSTVDPAHDCYPIAKFFNGIASYLEPVRWLPANSVHARPAQSLGTLDPDDNPPNGLAPRRVTVDCTFMGRDWKQQVTLMLTAVRIVGLRFTLPAVGGKSQQKQPRKECCGTLGVPTKLGVRLVVDNNTLFSGNRQRCHPVCVDVRPGGRVSLNYMGLMSIPDRRLSYQPGVTLIALLLPTDHSTGSNVPTLAECTVLSYSGESLGNRHRLRLDTELQGRVYDDGTEFVYDLNAFNHCKQRLKSAAGYHEQIRLYCEQLCLEFHNIDDNVTRRRNITDVADSELLLVDFDLEDRGTVLNDLATWSDVHNSKTLAEKLTNFEDETTAARVCGNLQVYPVYISSPEAGMGKTWVCEQLTYFVASELANKAVAVASHGVPLVPLLVKVDFLERELCHLAKRRGGSVEHICSPSDLLPLFISLSYPGESNELRRHMLMQAFEMHALLVVIDGVDDAVETRKPVMAMILDVLSSGFQMVVTSRPDAELEGIFRGFVTCNLRKLSIEQQQQAYALQVGKESSRLRFFEKVLAFTQFRNGHDQLYRLRFDKGLDFQVENLPRTDRIIVEGRRNPEARQKLEGRFVERLAEEATPRSHYLRELCQEFGLERLQEIDEYLLLVARKVAAHGRKPKSSDLKPSWFEERFANVRVCDIAFKLAALTAKLHTVLPVSTRLPTSKTANETPCRKLWRSVVARTDEIYSANEDVKPIFEQALQQLAKQLGGGIELTFCDLKDPLNIHEDALDQYAHCFRDGVLPEANVLDVIRVRAVCSRAKGVLALQNTMLAEGGVHISLRDAKSPDGPGIAVQMELWRCKNSFAQTNPTHFRSLANEILVTATLHGRPLRAFAELQVQHKGILAHNDEESVQHLDFFRSLIPDLSQEKTATLIDTSLNVLEDASRVPLLLALMVSIYDTPDIAGIAFPRSRFELYQIAVGSACKQAAATISVASGKILQLLKLIAFDAHRLDVELGHHQMAQHGSVTHYKAHLTFGQRDIDRLLVSLPDLQKIWSTLATSVRGPPLILVLSRDASGAGEEFTFVHRSIQEALAAMELIERGPAWPGWSSMPLAISLLNERSQANLWAIAASELSLLFSLCPARFDGRGSSWDFTAKDTFKAAAWQSRQQLLPGAQSNDTALKDKGKGLQPLDDSFGITALSHFLRCPHKLQSLVLPDRLGDDVLRIVGLALLANPASPLSSFKWRGFSVDTRLTKKVSLANQSGFARTQAHKCIQVGAATVLAAFSRSVKSLNLNNNLAEAAGAGALGRALQLNVNLTALDLDCNVIADGGAAGLARGLIRNTTLTHLSVANNRIRALGVTAIADSLRLNMRSAVKTLRLDGNFVGAGAVALNSLVSESIMLERLQLCLCGYGLKDIPGLVNALVETKSLTALDFAGNEIGPGGVRLIAPALDEITKLQTLDLSHNALGNRGVAIICLDRDNHGKPQGLCVNQSLTSVNLSFNGVDTIEGDGSVLVQAASTVFATNTSLEKLSLHGSRFDAFTASKLSEALQRNASLKAIDLRQLTLPQRIREQGQAVWKELAASRPALEVVASGSPLDARAGVILAALKRVREAIIRQDELEALGMEPDQ